MNQIGLFDDLPPIEIQKPDRPVEVKSVRHDEETNRVYVTLDAKRERKYKYLETVAVNAFQHWQTYYYRKLGYKSSRIIKYDNQPHESDDNRYYFVLVIELIFEH